MNPSPVVLRAGTKRNHTEMTPDPIIFAARGLDLDTRLNVFDQEFHVHSAILKLKSNYFWGGMDFPGKIPIINCPFKYEWITKIDDDGSWSLTSEDSDQVTNQDISMLKGDKDSHIRNYENLLHAMYGESFRISRGHQQLIAITALADSICAVPALSNSVGALMAQGDIRVRDRRKAEKLIVTAVKLRHPQLFRDCVCALASFRQLSGDEDAITIDGDMDPEARQIEVVRIVKAARAQILEKIVLIDEYKIKLIISSPAFKNRCTQLSYGYRHGYSGGINSLFDYYKELGQVMLYFVGDADEFRKPILCIKALLDNKMVSFPGAHDSSTFTQGRFLCAEVADEDLPWDITQKDW